MNARLQAVKQASREHEVFAKTGVTPRGGRGAGAQPRTIRTFVPLVRGAFGGDRPAEPAGDALHDREPDAGAAGAGVRPRNVRSKMRGRSDGETRFWYR